MWNSPLQLLQISLSRLPVVNSSLFNPIYAIWFRIPILFAPTLGADQRISLLAPFIGAICTHPWAPLTLLSAHAPGLYYFSLFLSSYQASSKPTQSHRHFFTIPLASWAMLSDIDKQTFFKSRWTLQVEIFKCCITHNCSFTII